MPAKTRDLDRNDWYLNAFGRFEQSLNGEAQTPLHARRRDAIDRFASLGFPTTRDEDWNYTSVAALVRRDFELALPTDADRVDAEALAPYLFEGEAQRLVFVNGHYAANLSRTDGLPAGLHVQSLRQAVADDPTAIAAQLDRLADEPTDGFTALNSAFLRDGAVVRLDADVHLEAPLHLLFLTAPGAGPTAAFGRVLFSAGPRSRGTLVETFAGLDGEAYLNSVATEMEIGEEAHIDHVKVQREAITGAHIGSLTVRQGRACRFTSTCLTLSGGLVRNDLRSILDGENVDSTLNGLYVLDGEEHTDNHTLIEHAQPHCSSHEFYKGILDGRSSGAFRGKIHVHPDAQKTDAFQSNQNLLLSDRAQVNTQPQLEIYADDVKCSHGATIGQLDAEVLFYLKSRGLPEASARRLLVHAFAGEVLQRLPLEGLRRQLEDLVTRKLERSLQGSDRR